MMSENPAPELQRDAQRLLGRCMLRIQQYERLMKTILAHHELAGPADTLESQRAERVTKLADKTLGTLVKSLFESYVVRDGQEREILPDDKVATDQISFGFRFSMSMPEERWNATKTAVEELVSMRNDLVHHLIERFDLWTEQGCIEVACHLRECYDRIDRHYEELAGWARTMDEARSRMASIAQTRQFHDMLVNGIDPDGSFAWSHTGIVSALREAAGTLAVDGWTVLGQAKDWIAAAHPDQTPEKYSCRTWPQVLSESRQFDLLYRTGEDGRRVAWFRPRS